MYGQLINLLSKEEILKFSREHNGERYVNHFDAYQHLVIMLYAVIKRFDSLREITDSMFPEARKLAHLGIRTMPRRSTLSDANARRPAAVYDATYRSLYARHKARIATYVDLTKKKPKVISLLTNDMGMDMDMEEIIAIYRKRWEIELLFKQLKQNFPLRYFYGESANAIKIQIWVTLIANLLLMVIQKRIKRPWSFSGLATIIRIMLMYYVNCYTFLEEPEKDRAKMVQEAKETPPEPRLFD